MRPRQRRAAACAIFLAWAVLGLAQAAPASASDSSDSPGPMESSALPTFQDCSAWSEISSGDADLQSLHAEMCARSAPSAPQTPAEAPPEEVQPSPEPVPESIPEAQQNYALIRDGAKVLASNPGAKKVAGILDDDSDTFMRNDCRDDKWVVLELSQVVKVSRIELAQHELYSSRVKEFEVRGRQTHPRTDGVEPAKALNSTAWKLVGRFTAERAKGVQNFAVERPIWARFLQVRFLTHYGAEPVCAVNGFAVYGKSAAEELEDQLAEDLEDLLAEERGSGKEGEDGGSGAAGAAAIEQVAQALAAGTNAENRGAGEQKSGIERGEAEEKDRGAEGCGAASTDATASPAPAPASTEPASGPVGAPPATPIAADSGAPAPSPAPAKVGGSEALSGKPADGSMAPNATASAAEAPKQDKQQQQQQEADEAKAASDAAGVGSSESGAPPSSAGSSDSAQAADGKAVATIPDTPAPTADADLANAATATTAAIPTGPGTTPATSAPADPLEDTLEPLPVPKTKAGGGIYETLVQEIRVAKAAQRQSAKALDALQRNVTALTAALSRVTTEYQVSESELAARVEAMVEARLTALHGRVAALGEALDRSSKREHAALSLLAMLGGALAVSLRGLEAKRWPRARAAVVALALANGAVGVALHWKSAR